MDSHCEALQMVWAEQTRVEVAAAARSSYSKELHTRLAEHTRSEVAVGAVISNSDDKYRVGGGRGRSDLVEVESASSNGGTHAAEGCMSDLSH